MWYRLGCLSSTAIEGLGGKQKQSAGLALELACTMCGERLRGLTLKVLDSTVQVRWELVILPTLCGRQQKASQNQFPASLLEQAYLHPK